MVNLVYCVLDIGTKISALKVSYPEIKISAEKIIEVTKWEDMAPGIIKFMKSWQVNYLVLEHRNKIERPTREENSWGCQDFNYFLNIGQTIRYWCWINKIKGCIIWPSEVKNYREKNDFCWRKFYHAKNKKWCEAHRRYEKEEVKHRDEVDCLILENIFLYTLWKDKQLLAEREKLFNSPLRIVGNYTDNSSRNIRLKQDYWKQERTNEPEEFPF